MGNYIILKWGSLKAYNFTDEFVEKNKKAIKGLNDIWDEIYNNRCGAMSGSDYLQSRDDLKNKLVDILETLYELGVPFQNGWTDEYFDSFDEIKDYIIKYNNR